ncbi:hypothetical protein H4V97_000023 [Flavobacterium sp. CG_23.5]|uniref:cell division protein FtsA n=1 Tax=Flavobacterium sp. CG_23.5 TaxID=2760708 RepID=UPI001AE32885|nr:cell division protein FtsA [Flavobacterium sp. CG_23.5]MBP2281705.1 hypothetical protein [Flavobacterium sp. CG_23.5]
MAKVFRFHDGSNNIEDWQTSTAYGKNAIEAIQDPSGSSANKEITSIPSPFARIDLVKTAFENLVNSNEVDGKTIFHKMVSDCFDVGEIFFNIDKLKEKINIIIWDKTNDLNKLLKSSSKKHRLLGETLKLYLEQDAKAYNFDKIERLYLLNYKLGNNELNIIGGTSPASLFFTSANKLNIDIRFGTDIVFDDQYQPLYKRDFNYVKFIFGIRKFMPRFNPLFKAVDDYLEMNYKMLTHEQRNILNNYTLENFNSEFEKLTTGTDGSIVEILDFPLRKKTERPSNIQDNSGFVIDSHKCKDVIKPLVLPIDDFSEKIIYTTALWDKKNRADFFDDKPLKERKLPFDDSIYPYLTIGDFFEDYIITTPYSIDHEKYFTGNLIEGSNKGYLLPIKKIYFDYFNIKDLMGVMPDGKKTVEIKEGINASVSVTLRVPVRDNKYITYSRIYKRAVQEHQLAEPDTIRNVGAIIENRFNITIYPFLKSTQGTPSYRVGVMNIDNHNLYSHSEYNLSFYNQGGEVKNNLLPSKRSDRKKGAQLDSNYHTVLENFEFIEIRHQWAKGILIPLLKEPSGVSQFTFAIDFGTTNTHIEYKKDNGNAMKFEISPSDSQIEPLFLMNEHTEKLFRNSNLGLLEEHIELEQIPKIINFFPTRTVISNNEELDYNKAVHSLADTNIPFYYGKKVAPSNTKIVSNLKWESTDHNEKRIETFLEKIILLIKNKVLLEKGSLEKTELIWMYPTSMSSFKINQLQVIWTELFEKHINKVKAPIKVAESITPFYYFRNEMGVSAGSNSVVSIDIGGGTTDVVIYKGNKPFLATSFRFAGNALFGDAFGDRNSNMNGFVQKYTEKYSSLLDSNGLYGLKSVLDVLNQNRKSEEIISFLLSLEGNDQVVSKAAPISFSKDLNKDIDLKVVVTLFYAAILYHIAKLMKDKDIVSPRYITFSGTGSKILNLIGSDAALQKLSQTIFDDVLVNENKTKIDLKKVNNPKEISCIGALFQNPEDRDLNIKDIETIYIGSNNLAFNNENKIKYPDLNDIFYKNVADEYISFIDWFFSINSKFKFSDELGINPSHFENYKNYLKEDVVDNVKKGIDSKKAELKGNQDEELMETLFFYPLIGGLNNLAYKIHQNL